jgi:polyhydroxyalkanoate synthase
MNHFDTIFDQIDIIWQAGLARLTHGISPAGMACAFYSWGSHLAQAPGKALEIITYPAQHMDKYTHRMTCKRDEAMCKADPRFKSKSWDSWPWRFYAETFLMMENWWLEVATNVPGMDNHDSRIVAFTLRQIMDAICPANFLATNPDVAHDTLVSGGSNLVRGMLNAFHDFQHLLKLIPEDEAQFKVGKNLAVTPGEVVFRNELIELIRYAPQSKTVYREPVLVLPAWIMKYYILDLSPHNSLVNWLVGQGHTVFMVSWKNPGMEDSGLSMDDYYRLGAMAAINAVSKAMPEENIHLAGYCLGGTLALITAAAMARDGNDRLKSLTLFAAQGDFTEAGELMLFVTPSEVSFLKNMMKAQGGLDTKQMAGTFQMLRSYDLIWSKIVSDYFQGKKRATFDLMAWNEDTTRMPYKMHSQYLEKLFLHNDFAGGRFKVEGEPVAAGNIQIPIFSVSTETDHVVPWRSVYKVHLITKSEVTFILTSGGHNAGIISEPGHKGRSYRIYVRNGDEPYLDPDTWLTRAANKKGSWWPEWQQWLSAHSAPDKMTPPPMGKSLAPAPGTYVFQE